MSRTLRSIGLGLAALYCVASSAPCPRPAVAGAAPHPSASLRAVEGADDALAATLVARCPCRCAEGEPGSASTRIAPGLPAYPAAPSPPLLAAAAPAAIAFAPAPPVPTIEHVPI